MKVITGFEEAGLGLELDKYNRLSTTLLLHRVLARGTAGWWRLTGSRKTSTSATQSSKQEGKQEDGRRKNTANEVRKVREATRGHGVNTN